MAPSDGAGVTSAVGRTKVIVGSWEGVRLARAGNQGCLESGLGPGRDSPNKSSLTLPAVPLSYVSIFILVVTWICVQACV